MNAIHTILACVACSAVALGAASVVPPKQQGHIRCLQTLTLKHVFDAGFRPYRVVESHCRVGKADLTLTLPDSNDKIPLDVDMISFTISRTDTVKAIDVRTKAAPIKVTGNILRQLGNSLGISFVGLDEAMARATLNNPRHTDTWTQDWSNEWLSIRFGFQAASYYVDDASKGYREMRAYAAIGIEWTPTEIGPTYRVTPIMPPKGYEHVSMDIPNSDLVLKAQISDSPSLAHLRYPNEEQRKTIIATATDTKPNGLSSLVRWPIIMGSIVVVLIVAACVLLWLLLKRRS